MSSITGSAVRPFLVSIALIAAAPFASAQTSEALPPEKTAETLLECASAHTHNIQLLKEMGQDVSKLYRQVGYFRFAGEAFSSKEFAEQKYLAARTALNARMEAALAEPEATRAASAQRFLDDLQGQLAACARFQRENVAAINERLKQSGLLKK